MNNNKTITELTNKHYIININTNINTNYQIKMISHLNIIKYYDVKWPMNEQLENSLLGLGRFSIIM